MPARVLIAAGCSLVVLYAAAPTANAARAGSSVNPQHAGLQVALRSWGEYRGAIDGIAGPMTAAAVRHFQKRKGLVVDGIPGPTTRRALGRLGRPLYGKRMLRIGMVGWDVSVLQFMLTRRGAPTGIIDGYFGRETALALRRFQRRAGLAADAVAGPVTRRALGGARAVRQVSTSSSGRSTIRGKLDYWAVRYGMSTRLVRALA
jgi:peptidoglycan hydrolase-like protein with peptidoglycan-binding domain